MVVMFCLNQAALLFIQLSVMSYVRADDHRNTLVSTGDSVVLPCNTSSQNITLIIWTNSRFVFSYLISENRNFSNFTSRRLRIDLALPTTLNIFNVQHEDAGLYKCDIIDTEGVKTLRWNLTVSEKPRGISQLWDLFYILTPVIGLLLCGFTLAVCICRKCWTGTPQKDSHDSRTLSYVQFVRLKEENYLYSSSAIKLCSIQRELREESI